MKKKNEMTISFKGTRPLKISGTKKATKMLTELLVRGAAEMHIDEQKKLGRSREEIVQAMVDRIRISEQHYKLGETDGFKCDLTDV